MSQFLPIFQLLNEANARYIVVGGIATILHGYVRATTDIDLVIDLHPKEVEKTIRALTAHGFKPRAPVDPLQFADPVQRASWLDEKGMQVFSMARPDNPGVSVDLFARHPIPFDLLWTRSILTEIGGQSIRICSIDDLIELKRQAGRPRDLNDIEQLSKIKSYGKPAE